MKKKNISLIFSTMFIPLFLFGATSQLINPQSGTIIDIGTKTPISNADVIIHKDWVQVDPALRQIDVLVYPKEREEEVYDCLIDDTGAENCPYDMVTCNGENHYKRGESVAHPVHRETTKERVSATASDRQDDTFYADWYIRPTGGAIDGSTATYVVDENYAGGASPQTLFNDGWQYNGKFAMKMFNYGSGCGGMSVSPRPDHVYTIIDGGSSVNLQSFVSNCNQLISSGDGKYATVLVTWDSIPTTNISFTCDDYCLAGKPTSPVGYWKWGCIDPKYTYDDTRDMCILDYTWYEYLCQNDETEDTSTVSWDENTPNGSWIGPLISSGGDCDTSTLSDSYECQSSTPPLNNCMRRDYTCPADPTQLCTKVPNELDSAVSNIEEGYIYSTGYSVSHHEEIIKDKTCPEDTVYNQADDVCVAVNSYKCLVEGFTYDPMLSECVKIPTCDGMIDPNTGACLTAQDITCEEGYDYNDVLHVCEKMPFCDKGTYNSITHLCEDSVSQSGCPSGYTLNETTSRCEKPLTTQTRQNCEDGFTYEANIGKCTLQTADFSDWTVYGSDSDWQVKDGGSYVKQMINGNNTFLISPYTLGTSIVLQGKFQVDNDGDDDWAGLAFGWNGTNDLYLFDWKKHDQGNAKKGLRLMHLTNYATGLWGATSTSEMTLLKSNFNYPGWSYGRQYTMRVEYTFGSIKAYIDGTKVLEYTDPNLLISGGKVGFFNLSQSKVSYRDFYIESDPTCDAGYAYSIPYDICYIEEPNAEEDFERGIAWLYPACPNGSFNTETLKCEYVPTCSSNGVLNSARNKCELDSTNTCPSDTLVVNTTYPGYETACSKTDLCPTGSYSQYFVDAGGNMCVSGKLASCKSGEVLNEELDRCEARPYCEEGYKETADKKCEKPYTWYSYYCEEGWEGPGKPGKDCLGYCGGYDCECNPETPLPNNCRQPLSTVFEREVLKERPMILHPVTGSLSYDEVGQVKGYQCGEDCQFIVNKVTGEGNQICFTKKTGEKGCFTVDNCTFFGKIENELGLKELQVGQEKNEENVRNGYQYILAEGNAFSKPIVADDSAMSCYDDSTVYNVVTKECEMTGNLDLRTWTIKGADANWVFNADGSVGTQTINTAQPTLLLHPDSFGDAVELSGQIMTTDSDDDWIGLTFGSNQDGTSYYRFTWHTTGGGNSNSGFDISKIVNGRKTELVGDYVSGDGMGYARNTWYKFGLKYMPGVIIGYVNDQEVIRFEQEDLDISGRVGFYGYSQRNVSYKNFNLTTSPKCPEDFDYDSTNKACIKVVESNPENIIHSTCKMNGHVGFFNNKTGIVAGAVESDLPTEVKDVIKSHTSSTFDPNMAKYNPEERISFWDPYQEYYLGFIEFINDVSEKDREDGFSPKEKLPYAMGEDGFTSIANTNGVTYYVSLGTIGYSLTEADCDSFANKYGLERVTDPAGTEDIFTRILSGGREISEQIVDPICTDGIFNPATGICDYAEISNPVQYCLNGKLRTKEVVDNLDLSGTIVIESTPNKGFDYSESVSGTPVFSNFGSNWKSEGYSLARTAIKLSDGNWYVKQSMQPGDSRACGWPSQFKTLPDSSYRVVGYTSTCYASSRNISNACASKIEITLPAGLSLKGISDIESVAANDFGTSACNGDNAYDEEYTVYKKDKPEDKVTVTRNGVGVQGSSAIDLTKTTNIGECVIYPRCILKDPEIGDFNIFNTLDTAVKVEKTNGDITYKCSAYKCIGGQCKTETCPEGFSGSKIPSGVEVEPEDCTADICDGNKDYIPYCGKDNGCPTGPGYLPVENIHGPCYEYYCENGGSFDPETNKCQELKCPANTHEISDGTCRRD